MKDELGKIKMTAVSPDLYYPGICLRTIQEAVASFQNTGTFLPDTEYKSTQDTQEQESEHLMAHRATTIHKIGRTDIIVHQN
jgi:hypothetical protein